MIFDKETLRRARSRDGEAAESRSDEVEAILGPEEKVGFRNELALLDRDYDAYPRGEELLRPAEGDALRQLADHPLVSDAEDIGEELRTDVGVVERAAELHGVDLPDGGNFDVEVNRDRLTALLGDVPTRFVSPNNPLLVTSLYVDRGLSISEIAEVLDQSTEDTTTVTETGIRQCLVDARVLEGTTSAESKRRRRHTRDEINRPDTSGLTITAEDH